MRSSWCSASLDWGLLDKQRSAVLVSGSLFSLAARMYLSQLLQAYSAETVGQVVGVS